MPKHAFHIFRPKTLTSGVVFASPHSGRDYPMSLRKRSVLGDLGLRSSEDAYVDRLFEAVPLHGAPFLIAGAPRAFVDLNRSPDELDPALINGVRSAGNNPRVASGLGVVPRVVSNGRAIYSGKLELDEARSRIASYWRPYHDQLQALLSEARTTFGEAILIDCHSMPHEALDSIALQGGRRPDVVIGDRFGASAGGEIVDRVEAALAGAGLHVIRNSPFAGAYITQHYGRPSRHQHAIQIEIDRSLYLDEAKVEPNARFHDFRRLLRGVIAEISEITSRPMPLAAE